MKGNKNNYVEIMELRSNPEIGSTSDENGSSLHTPAVNGRNSISVEDSGDVTTDYYAADSVIRTKQTMHGIDGTDIRPRRQISKKSAGRRNREAVARRTSPDNGLKLNIPIDPTDVNDLSAATDLNKDKESNGYSTASDNGSINENNGLMDAFRNTINGSHNSSREANQEPHNSAGLQYLKALRESHAPRKSAIPVPMTAGSNEPRSDSTRLQEFQEVAKNLRHVAHPELDSAEVNGNHEAVSRNLSAPCISASPRLNHQDLEERQRTMEAKASKTLAHTAFQTFSNHGKHDTLPRNLGMPASRPSLVQSSKHQRQSSDPDVYYMTEREEIQVVPISSTGSPRNQEMSPKKQMVVTSKISSEIYFSASGDKSERKSPKQTENVFSSFLDCTEKPVIIYEADGSISHYGGSAETLPESVETQRGKRPSNLKNLTKPYKVVDVTHKPPVLSPEFASPLSPQLPLSPSPTYRSSDGDLNLDSEQTAVSKVRLRSKDSLAKFPKRHVALVDGIYSVKDSVQFSSENICVTQTGHKDITSPLSDDGSTTPSFPILLSESESEPGDKRRHSNSSNYKVPIFIGPKNYDNVGTVLSDMELSLSDLSKDKSGQSGKGNYGYLTPMHSKKEVKQGDEEPPPVPVRTSSELKLPEAAVNEAVAQTSAAQTSAASVKQNKHPKKPRRTQGKEPNSNNCQSSSESRWRSKTHPLGMDPIYAKINLDAKKSHSSVARSNTDVGKSKQKRLAPLPPQKESQDAHVGHSVPDSLPRGIPPPPPGREKRMSTELNPGELSPRKPAAPAPPTDLDVIYESLSGESTHPNAVTVSPSKPHPVPSSRTSQQEPGTAQKRAQSPQRRHSQTPTKERVVTPTKEPKPFTESKGLTSPPKETHVNSPQRPMSPPIPCSPNGVAQLPESSPFHNSPNGKEPKLKRSKLPWKRTKKRRDDRGSPDREFDSTEVEKWLEKVHQQNTEGDIQRNSMDRIEVINAYRGEQTAFIDHSELQSPSTSPEHTGEDSDGSGIKLHTSTTSNKRRAPNPPSGGRPASWMEGTKNSPCGSTEDIQELKKYSLSPQSRRRVSDGDKLAQYENTGQYNLTTY